MSELLDKTMLLVKSFQLGDLNSSGQNFLIDETVLKKEITLADLKSSDVVLDIGAGFGYEISEIRKLCKIIGVEKNFKIFSYLINKYELDSNVKLINGDALKIVYPKFNKVISNPPYNIADRILQRLGMCDFESGVMILPKGIAESLTGTGQQNRMSITLRVFIEFEEIETVPKEAFYPAPRVVSKLLKLKRIPYNFVQSVLKRDEMTVKNAILRAHQELEQKTKRESREFLSKLDVGSLQFKDKEIKKLNANELSVLLTFLKENYTFKNS